jgi:Yip1-like protein
MDLVTRAKSILTAPKTEWPVIASESTGTAALYTGYVMPMAAITPVASIIGNLIFSHAMSFGESVAFGIVNFVMALVGVYILGLIASKIAPSFGGRDDMTQGLKLVAYAYTPAWIAGIIALIPAVALLSLIGGLYSLYLLYVGAPAMMSVPEGRSAGYTAVVILVAIGVYIVISILVGIVVATIIAVH